mmetsp:Transcript_59874/g.106792  ORF Transcript_59874/g.106792 Transcript_59874/m.106792 type:complete len:311 (+) Transcript_59874:2-934(+)
MNDKNRAYGGVTPLTAVADRCRSSASSAFRTHSADASSSRGRALTKSCAGGAPLPRSSCRLRSAWLCSSCWMRASHNVFSRTASAQKFSAFANKRSSLRSSAESDRARSSVLAAQARATSAALDSLRLSSLRRSFNSETSCRQKSTSWLHSTSTHSSSSSRSRDRSSILSREFSRATSQSRRTDAMRRNSWSTCACSSCKVGVHSGDIHSAGLRPNASCSAAMSSAASPISTDASAPARLPVDGEAAEEMKYSGSTAAAASATGPSATSSASLRKPRDLPCEKVPAGLRNLVSAQEASESAGAAALACCS